jgi:uncharacterized membrane protein YtjA (UPF0391 family)
MAGVTPCLRGAFGMVRLNQDSRPFAGPCLFTSYTKQPEDKIMLSWSLTFLIFALIAALLGFTGLAGAAVSIAKILFIVFLVMFLLSLIFSASRRA